MTVAYRNKVRMITTRMNDAYHTNSKVTDKLVTGAWRGKRCFIIGGGESLEGFDSKVLVGEKTIGINRAFERHQTTLLYMMDVRMMLMLEQGELSAFDNSDVLKKWQEFKGVKVALSPMSPYMYPKDVYVVRQKINKELSLDLGQGIYGGSNSGFGAIQLAMCLGASPIYLLGYDLKLGNVKTHWHSGYPKQKRQELAEQLVAYKIEFEAYAQKIEDVGFNVYNLSVSSAVNCFQFRALNEVLGICA